MKNLFIIALAIIFVMVLICGALFCESATDICEWFVLLIGGMIFIKSVATLINAGYDEYDEYGDYKIKF